MRAPPLARCCFKDAADIAAPVVAAGRLPCSCCCVSESCGAVAPDAWFITGKCVMCCAAQHVCAGISVFVKRHLQFSSVHAFKQL